MKKHLPAFLVLATLVASAPSLALVIELAACTTHDGAYSVLVFDNQGTGPVRTSHISAVIKDANGQNVAGYEAEYLPFHSVSFGGVKYIDKEQKGKQFSLEAPSTNYPHFRFSALVEKDSAQMRISDAQVQCTIFNGHAL